MNKLSSYDQRGMEVPDPDPVAVPIDFERPKPLAQRIRELVRSESFIRELDANGVETFNDADDFDIPDDPIDRTTPYEDGFDPSHPGIIAREQEIRSGFVEDRPIEQKEAAREKIAQARRERDAKMRPVSKSKNGVGSGDVGVSDVPAEGDAPKGVGKKAQHST